MWNEHPDRGMTLSHATLIHLSRYRSIQKGWLINDLYEDIVIYFSYSNRWNIKNGLTDCGEPQRDTYNCSIDAYISNKSRDSSYRSLILLSIITSPEGENTYGVGVTKVIFRWSWFIDSNDKDYYRWKRERTTYNNITLKSVAFTVKGLKMAWL